MLSHLFFLISLFIILGQISSAQDKKWRPVSPAELQMKTPLVEADADAEAIFWEVRVADEKKQRADPKTVLNHYLRIKIFTERGRENHSKIDIGFGKISELGIKTTVKDIAARTIKPDGTIIELKPEDVFERDVVKGEGIKYKAKSFAVPGIETGAIVEYRWKEIHGDTFSFYTRLPLAREIPVQFVKYYVKPFTAPNFTWGMRIHSFNTQNSFVKDEDGFYSTTMTDVPAFKEEPRMPPEYEVKPWILVYYAEEEVNMSADDYWRSRGRGTFEAHKDYLKINEDIRRAAVQAVGDASETEEKIRRIFEFCRKNIENLDDDSLSLTAEQRKDIKPNKNSTDTLRRGQGTWHDVNMLFAAMLVSAGFDARVANVALRTNPQFDRRLTNDYFIRTETVAVKVGSDWKFYDPGTRYVPFGMNYWSEEGQAVLISDVRSPFWMTIPQSPADKSKQKRVSKLRLTEDGTLEGDVTVEYTGHLAQYYKDLYDGLSHSEREKTLSDRVKAWISNSAEITNISFENVKDSDLPLSCSFKIRVPSYTQRTGKRIFLQPNIFAYNTNALFTTSVRKNEIFFQYPWTEEELITIESPQGFSPESADAPAAVNDRRKFGFHETKISVSDNKKSLTYERRFSFSGDGNLVFPVGMYSYLKDIFETYNKADKHSVMLVQNLPQTPAQK